VVPELDAPGHGYSYGLAFPEMVAPCTNVPAVSDIGPVNVVPIDPTSNVTYAVLETLLGEFAAAFPDEFVHLGGDEMQLACWEAEPHIKAFMVGAGFLFMCIGKEKYYIYIFIYIPYFSL
jgi:hexosaminidase